MSNFVMYDDIKKEDLGQGVSRKVLAYSENIMMVEVSFEAGAIGALHKHPHEQATYVLEGAFEFSMEDEKKVVRKGDTLYFSPDAVHGVVCIEEGKLLDVFTPMRKDFIR